MPLECVIDAGLFKKYCSNDRCCYITSVVRHLLDSGEDDYIIKECSCITEFLDAIGKGKCILAYNNEITREYALHLEKMPEDIVYLLTDILSKSEQTKKIDRGCFKSHDFDEVESTELGCKVKYLDIAKCLENRTIVSSKEEVDSTYMPYKKILLVHGITARCVCDQWKEVKNAK